MLSQFRERNTNNIIQLFSLHRNLHGRSTYSHISSTRPVAHINGYGNCTQRSQLLPSLFPFSIHSSCLLFTQLSIPPFTTLHTPSYSLHLVCSTLPTPSSPLSLLPPQPDIPTVSPANHSGQSSLTCIVYLLIIHLCYVETGG